MHMPATLRLLMLHMLQAMALLPLPGSVRPTWMRCHDALSLLDFRAKRAFLREHLRRRRAQASTIAPAADGGRGDGGRGRGSLPPPPLCFVRCALCLVHLSLVIPRPLLRNGAPSLPRAGGAA